MDKLPFEVPDSLVESPPKIFSDVKYCLEGTVDPKITKILENGGAKKLGYLSISATHMLVGEGANDVKLAEADEVFDVPLVQARWVAYCAKAGKLLPLRGFEGNSRKLFSSLIITSSGLKGADLANLAALVSYYGGHYQHHLTTKCTHLVKNNCEPSKKYLGAKDRGIKVVCCDWVTECIKANSVLDELKFDPQFIVTAESSKGMVLKTPQLKTTTETVTPKASKLAGPRPTLKISQTPTSVTPTRPLTSQAAAMLQAQLSGSQTPPGPRGRGTAIRHQTAQQQKAQGGATQIRAHRPLLVNTQQPPKPVSKAGATQSQGKPQPPTPTSKAGVQQKTVQQRSVPPPPPPVVPVSQVPQVLAQPPQQSPQNQPSPLVHQVSQQPVSMPQQQQLPPMQMQLQQQLQTSMQQQQGPTPIQQQQLQTSMQQQQGQTPIQQQQLQTSMQQQQGQTPIQQQQLQTSMQQQQQGQTPIQQQQLQTSMQQQQGQTPIQQQQLPTSMQQLQTSMQQQQQVHTSMQQQQQVQTPMMGMQQQQQSQLQTPMVGMQQQQQTPSPMVSMQQQQQQVQSPMQHQQQQQIQMPIMQQQQVQTSMQQQQVQTSMQQQQVQTSMQQQQVQASMQQQLQTTLQQQQQLHLTPGQHGPTQQQQIQVQIQQQQQMPSLQHQQQQQLHLQQQLQSQQQQNTLQQNQHSSLHQQLQQGQLHSQESMVQQQHQPITSSHQPTQLQAALSQPSQPSQQLQSQPISQLQQSSLAIQQMQQQQIPMDGNSPQQFVLQNQLPSQMQQMHPQFKQNTSMQNQQVMSNQQMQYVHHQTLQQPPVTVPHSQSQVGIQNQQSHAIIQQQQGMQQHQRPLSQQGHPMHLQQQMHGPGMQGMQFQHGQSMQSHQMQPHGLQQMQQQNPANPQQVLQSQKSPLPPPTQALQNIANSQQQQSHQQMLSQQQQQPGLVHQLGIPPQHQALQQQQQQNYQMQNTQQLLQNQMHPQQQQQMQNQQQFNLPQQSKTPPHQLHPQSPQHHQLMNQQHMQGQVGMRPPQSPQQQSQQPVHFQILQPQNRLQVVMGSQGSPSFQQGQPPTSSSQPGGMGNQQQMFRQQQPLPLQPGQLQGINKPQGQMFHPLQQHPQPRQQQGMIQMQQQGHPAQMQGGQPGHGPNAHPQSPNQLQPMLSPQQLQSKQFQEIGPSAGQQLQQGSPHYNVVIHQGQQFTQMNQRPPGLPRHPGKPGAMQAQSQMQVGQRVGFPPGAPRPGGHQWTQQQQMEIFRQIQMDPNIKAKWAQMDQQQRQLLVQKLAQRHREDQLRKEMMLRQQQLNQQNAAMQGQQQQQQGQVSVPPQATATVPGSPHFHPSQNQGGLVQQPLPQSQGQESHMVVAHQGSPTMVSQPTPSPIPQSNSGQMPGSPVVTNAQGQQILMSNHTMLAQQKLISPQSPSPTQRFPPPSPLQQLQNRASSSMISGQQGAQQGQIIRTQNVFTPQVGQQSQRMVNVQHVVVHQGQGGSPQQQQQQPRFPQQQIVLQQQQQQQHQVLPGHGQPGTPQQKVAVLPGPPQQSPTQQVQGGVQWLPGAPPQQRLTSPTQGSPQFPPRMPGTPDQQRSPGQVWNARQHSPIAPPTPLGVPGSPSNNPFVQVVNSKTKTALANLLNNRLQGNSTGTDSSTTPTSSSPIATASASTTITMCSPSQNPPAFSSQSPQLPLQHPVSQATSQSLNVISQRTLSNLTNSCKTIHQVSGYGGAGAAAAPATRPATLSQSPTSISLQSARTPFYGHEPNFKAPVNGFLLGCVFWAAQQMDRNNWQDIVSQYGGESVGEYTPAKVTHVLCKNQRFPELQQVLREGKRIVTLHWLSDTCGRKVMAPPFYAIHLPTSFNDDNLPLKGQAFSLTGFEGEDRDRLIKMLKLCGADVTLYFTKLNKGLVSCKSDGQKYTKAREWKTPIVNIQFLNELLLGNQTCLQMIHSPKYQNFTLEQPFRFDINIAPHLMAAWKNPVRVSNEVVEQFKSLKRPLEKPVDEHQRAKRIKLEEDEKTLLAYLEQPLSGELLNVDKKEDIKPDIENKPPPVIMFTGFSPKFKSLATERVKELGARVTNECKEATHLVAGEIATPRLYTALCHVKYIVGAPWIRESCKAKRFVDEGPYVPKVIRFEQYHKVKIADVLKKSDRHLLFKGMTFYITPGITGTFREGLETVINAAGGHVDKLQKSMSDVKSKARKNPRKYIVITNIEDFEYFSHIFYYKQSKPLSIFTCLFIYKSIADQKVDLGPLPPKKAIVKADSTKAEPPNSTRLL